MAETNAHQLSLPGLDIPDADPPALDSQGCPFTVCQVQTEGDHRWAVLDCKSDPDDTDDALVNHILGMVRDAYGENDIIAILESYTTDANLGNLPEPDPSVMRTFDIDAIVQGFRLGLPDPTAEGRKPPQLTNYRSETTEMVARGALAAAYDVRFHAAPQRGKTNADQPVRGFDGWGIVNSEEDGYALVLVQVKGTEEEGRPPAEAHTLVEECKRIPRQRRPISRALSVLLISLKDSPLQVAILHMMETLGKGNLPRILVAPVIVRGRHPAHIDDLGPLRRACDEFSPATSYGVTVSINMSLQDFGRIVMSSARAA